MRRQKCLADLGFLEVLGRKPTHHSDPDWRLSVVAAVTSIPTFYRQKDANSLSALSGYGEG